jgi:hypothetical protein
MSIFTIPGALASWTVRFRKKAKKLHERHGFESNQTRRLLARTHLSDASSSSSCRERRGRGEFDTSRAVGRKFKFPQHKKRTRQATASLSATTTQEEVQEMLGRRSDQLRRAVASGCLAVPS